LKSVNKGSSPGYLTRTKHRTEEPGYNDVSDNEHPDVSAFSGTRRSMMTQTIRYLIDMTTACHGILITNNCKAGRAVATWTRGFYIHQYRKSLHPNVDIGME